MEIATSISFLCPILLIILQPDGWGWSDSSALHSVYSAWLKEVLTIVTLG